MNKTFGYIEVTPPKGMRKEEVEVLIRPLMKEYKIVERLSGDLMSELYPGMTIIIHDN